MNNFIPPQDWEQEEDGTYLSEDGSKYDANGKYIPYTKADVEHPGSRKTNETYKQYRERVDKAKELGFHLGDLSWSDWHTYCKGSDYYDDSPSTYNHDDDY